MEQIKTNPILKFNENQLHNVRIVLGYGDVNKLKQDIEQLVNWIRKQNHFKVKDFDSEYLERVLIFNKGSIERAKRRLDKLCTCVNLMPEFLQNFDIKNEFIPLFKVVNICVLPKPTEDNYRIFTTNLTGYDDTNFHPSHYVKYVVALVYYTMNHDYCQGYEVIADTKNFIFSVLCKVNPIVVHKGLTLVTDAMGQRLKKIHFISHSKYFEAFLTFFKQGLSTKLKERIMIHPNYQSLYEHFPREVLPEEFGGYEMSIKQLNDLFFQEICTDSNIAKLKFLEKTTTDESCRHTSQLNEEYSGIPGSFKTLCVD